VSAEFVAGFLFGDHAFPSFEGTLGDPTTDLVLGALGAIRGRADL
jgi:hypothetical protein